MSEQRPRPQYGEYATPEEQARAMGIHRPLPPPVPGTAVPPAAEARHPPLSAPVVPPLPEAATMRRWDVTASAVLLMIGLYSVLYTFVLMAQLPAALSSALAAWGITQPFTSLHAASVVAIVVDVVYGVLWIAALGGTIARLRRRRSAFWIPLTAGIVAVLVWLVLVSAMLVHDPAFTAYLQRLSG